MGESDNAKRWRARAEHLRSIAAVADDAIAKRTLMRLARDWERMADRNDQAERPSVLPSPPPRREPRPRPGKKGPSRV